MTIWNVKKKKEKVKVTCSCCDVKQEFECSSVKSIPTGYKGRISFFVECNHCHNKVYVNERYLSKKFVREVCGEYL